MEAPLTVWSGLEPGEHASEAWIMDALEGVAELNRMFQSELPKGGVPAEVFALSLPVLRRLFDFEAVSLLRPDDDGLFFSLVGVDPPRARVAAQSEMDFQVSEGQFAFALYQNRAVVVPSHDSDRWVLLHTLVSGDRVLGMLMATLDQPFLDEPDLGQKVLYMLMQGWASVIESGALNRELARRARSLEAEVERQTHELRRSEEEARRANAAKDEFLAKVSHEIRTPLAGILGTADLLCEATLDPEARDRAETIHRTSTLALEIVNEILDIARIESGRIELDPVDFDLRALMTDVVALLETGAIEKGIGLGLDWEPGTPTWVHGDPLRLRQIVTNLVSNAVKFTEQGQVRVEVTPVGDLDTSGEIRVSVSDSGVGIPPERLESVFEKFEQADAATAARYGGTGLGLPISRELAELMGGQVAVESTLGVGSAFSVVVPLPRVEGHGAEDGLGPEEVAPISFDGTTAVLADDDPVARGVALTHLERLGCRVWPAADGREALEIVMARRPDVVFMDGNMPNMDGFEATRAIVRSLGQRAPPVIALSAGAMERDRTRSHEAGMSAHLTKPVRPADLRDALIEVLPLRAEDGHCVTRRPPADGLTVLDRVVVEERFGADHELFNRLGQVFLETWPASIDQLREAAAVEDAAALARVAHRIRGAIATLGAMNLSHVVERLEVEWATGRLEDVAYGIALLEESVEGLRRELESGAVLEVVS